MKKFYSFLFAAVALVGFAACNSDSTEEPTPDPEVGKMEFKANIGEETKTALDGFNVVWCEGDKIGIWDGTKTREFTATEVDGNTATFEGMAALNQEKYYAVYPYVKDATCNNGTWTGVTFNNDQEAKAGSFADGANIAFAEADGTLLTFKNSLSVLKFQVPEACKLVEFFNGEKMTNLVVKAWASDDNKMQPETDYYVTLPAGTYNMYARIDGCKSGKKSITVEAGNIHNLGTLPAKKTTTVYLKVNSDWKTDNARFAVNFFLGSSNYWADMKLVSGDVYSAEISADAATCIFCRMNPGTTENKWDNKWNQTDDLTVPADKARYCITGWDKSGYWEKVLYLVPNSNWTQANARFAVALLNSDKSVTDWCDMTKVSGQSYYEVYFRVDKNYKYVIYCRMNPGTTENKWENKWDQTNDLEIPTNVNNCYTVKSGTWSNGGGTWSKK